MGELRSTNYKQYNPCCLRQYQGGATFRRVDGVRRYTVYLYCDSNVPIMLQLNKVSSSSKLEEPPSLPTSPAGKFRRTSKKDSAEETNATSEKTESTISQGLSASSKQPITRTNRLEKRQDSRNLSTIDDPFLSAKTANSKIRTEPDEITLRPNFTKKMTAHLSIGPVLSPENQTKALKSTLSPRSHIGNPSNATTPSEAEQLGSILKPKIMLKRGSAFAFILGRLFREKIAASLKALSDNKRVVKIKHQKQAYILSLAVCELCQRVEKRMKWEAIDRCKTASAKLGKESFMMEQEFHRLNQKKLGQFLPGCLHLLSRSKLRSSFCIVNKNRALKQLLSRGYPALLDFYEKRKLRSAFEVFKRSAAIHSQRKRVLLAEFAAAFRLCSTLPLSHPFRNIALFATAQGKTGISSQKSIATQGLKKDHSSRALTAKQQQFEGKRSKISSEIESIQREANAVSQKIAQKKRTNENESKRLKKAIETLSKRQIQMQEEGSQRRAINKGLKEQADSLAQLEPASEETTESSLPVLQRLYSQISKTPEEQFPQALPRVLEELKISASPRSRAVQGWVLLGERQGLQGEIDAYEDEILGRARGGQSAVGRMMREESAMVAQMIKNYIKERYLWCEVQQFVANVL